MNTSNSLNYFLDSKYALKSITRLAYKHTLEFTQTRLKNSSEGTAIYRLVHLCDLNIFWRFFCKSNGGNETPS